MLSSVVKGFGLQTLVLRGFAMLARFLAGGACAVGMLASVCVTPAAAHPYDQYIRGRSFFGALFGPSIARAAVSYPSNQKPGTIVVSTAQRRLHLVLGNGQALSYGIGVGKEASPGAASPRSPTSASGRTGRRPIRCCVAGPICRTTWLAAPTIRWGHAGSISAPASIAFTARTSPTRSARPCRRVASACPTTA